MIIPKPSKAPCYKCEDRVVGCHGTCERYIAYASANAQERTARFEERERKTKLISAKRQKEINKRQGEK